MKTSELITKLKRPIHALCQKDFYVFVLLKLRGLGFSYLFYLSAFLSIFVSYPVYDLIQQFKVLNIPSLVNQIPASYFDANGVLRPEQGQQDFLIITDENNKAVIIYNPLNKDFDRSVYKAPIELRDKHVLLDNKASNGADILPYSAFVSPNTTFEPLETAKLIDQVLSMNIIPIYLAMILWFVYSLFLNTLILGLIVKPIYLLAFKIKLAYKDACRLSAYASTSAALLILLEFLFNFTVSWVMLLFIPLLYLLAVAKHLRRALELLNKMKEDNKQGLDKGDGNGQNGIFIA